MVRIFPSLISADILHLQSTIEDISENCAGFHIDIMDYHFVPNLTWGPMFANAIRKVSNKQLWIDLLVEHPEQYLDDLTVYKGDMITFHIESKHPKDTIIAQIRQKGARPGIGINPATPLAQLTPYLAEIDHVLLMSVEPGFSGQAFIPESINRLKQLVTWRNTQNYTYTIAMDGGIDASNIQNLGQIGCDIFAVGSGVFNAKHPAKQLQKLSALLQS